MATIKEVERNGRVWTKEDIKTLLESNAKAVARAIVILYNNQTADEQAYKETGHCNGRGFNKIDAEIFSSFAEQLEKGRTLSPKQLALSFRRIPKYAGQILRHMAEQA